MEALKNFYEKHPVIVIGAVFFSALVTALTVIYILYQPILELKNTEINQLKIENTKLKSEVDSYKLKVDSSYALLDQYKSQLDQFLKNRKQILMPTVLSSGESVDLLEGKLMLTAKWVNVNDSIISRSYADLALTSEEAAVASKYDPYIEYFQSLISGDKRFFNYKGKSYTLNILGIGDFNGKKGVKVAIYTK